MVTVTFKNGEKEEFSDGIETNTTQDEYFIYDKDNLLIAIVPKVNVLTIKITRTK